MSNISIPITENGTTTLATAGKYCDKNVDVVVNVAGGGGDLPEEAFNIAGDCGYRFCNNGWNWFLESYGERLMVNPINNCQYMFGSSSNLSKIGAETINFTGNNGTANFENMFRNCSYLTEIPYINISFGSSTPTVSGTSFSNMFSHCSRVKSLENVFDSSQLEYISDLKVTGAYICPKLNGMFDDCFSLRYCPTWIEKLRPSTSSSAYIYASYYIYYYMFQNCYALDEVVNVPVLQCSNKPDSGMATTNYFNYAFQNCSRVKKITFASIRNEDFDTVRWGRQTIDLSLRVGWASDANNILNYAQYSGCTSEKRVTDDATYQALKDDADWWTTNVAYSRYNLISAKETINSLPTSTLKTNTIKFKGAAGSATDGGAIENLPASDISSATNKGWTVAFV